jgi:hypothetical protein
MQTQVTARIFAPEKLRASRCYAVAAAACLRAETL